MRKTKQTYVKPETEVVKMDVVLLQNTSPTGQDGTGDEGNIGGGSGD